MNTNMTRRALLKRAGALGGAAVVAGCLSAFDR